MQKIVATDPPSVNPDDDHVRLGLAFGNAVNHLARTRHTAYANRTLGEFIDAVVSLGVRLDEPLASIEFGVSLWGSGYVQVHRGEDGTVEIREVRR